MNGAAFGSASSRKGVMDNLDFVPAMILGPIQVITCFFMC